MKRYNKAFDKLYYKLQETEESKSSLFLIVDSIISSETAYKEVPKLYGNEILVSGRATSIIEIPLHTKFEVIYPSANPRDYIECEVILNYINERHFKLDALYPLHYAMCILSFSSAKPEILNQLGIFGKTGPNDDCLNFTTKALMNKIIEIMNAEGL